jgi:uncharacterized RDD family membrane protein YckC
VNVELPPVDEQGRFQAQLVQASFASRLVAKAIDLVLSGLVSLGFLAVTSRPLASLVGMAWLCLTDWSGSPGKWLLRIRTVGTDGRPCGPLASLQRNFMLALPTLGRSLIVSGWFGADPQSWADRLVLAVVGLGIALGEVAGMVLREQGRRWGDRLAGTRVVRR